MFLILKSNSYLDFPSYLFKFKNLFPHWFWMFSISLSIYQLDLLDFYYTVDIKLGFLWIYYLNNFPNWLPFFSISQSVAYFGFAWNQYSKSISLSFDESNSSFDNYETSLKKIPKYYEVCVSFKVLNFMFWLNSSRKNIESSNFGRSSRILFLLFDGVKYWIMVSELHVWNHERKRNSKMYLWDHDPIF